MHAASRIACIASYIAVKATCHNNGLISVILFHSEYDNIVDRTLSWQHHACIDAGCGDGTDVRCDDVRGARRDVIRLSAAVHVSGIIDRLQLPRPHSSTCPDTTGNGTTVSIRNLSSESTHKVDSWLELDEYLN